MQTFKSPLLSLLLAVLLATPPVATAAESYDNCTGFVESLPATITTQGTWCLRKDLVTSITSGSAVTIATNNVTLNCNDFKIGGLGAGDGSRAEGVMARYRTNITVRKCNIRGFYRGAAIIGGTGHLIEDNRFEQNLEVGIYVLGDNNENNNMIRRNSIFDTGYEGGFAVSGINAEADIIDNTVSGVFAADAEITGIVGNGTGQIKGNRVRGLAVPSSGGPVAGIWGNGGRHRVSGNHISAESLVSGWGVTASGFCDDNTVSNFTTGIDTCQEIGGNASH